MTSRGTGRTIAFMVLAVAAMPSLAAAEHMRAGVVTTVRGSATVTRDTASPPVPLRFKDDVFVHDRIVTGNDAIAQVLLGGKAIVTVREHSELTITEVPGMATVDLRAGRIALAVLRHRMQPGDSVEIRTPNAVAGVRGTVVIADVARAAAEGQPESFTTRITVLRGLVDVTQRDARSGVSAGVPVNVHALESVLVRGATMPTTPERITPAAAQGMVRDFRVGIAPSPAAARAVVTEAQMTEAVAYASAVLHPGNGQPDGSSNSAGHRGGRDAADGAKNGGDDTVSAQTASTEAASIPGGPGGGAAPFARPSPPGPFSVPALFPALVVPPAFNPGFTHAAGALATPPGRAAAGSGRRH
jgi:hypothetical protein